MFALERVCLIRGNQKFIKRGKKKEFDQNFHHD